MAALRHNNGINCFSSVLYSVIPQLLESFASHQPSISANWINSTLTDVVRLSYAVATDVTELTASVTMLVIMTRSRHKILTGYWAGKPCSKVEPSRGV